MRLFGKRPLWTLIRLMIIILASYTAFRVMLLPIRVTGISMEPTYMDGEINFIHKYAYLHTKPARGDIIGIQYRAEKKFIYLKRVIGLPGETIYIEHGDIFIGGIRLKEPYVKYKSEWNLSRPILLNRNEYFVIGDNRDMELRDHTLGKINKDLIAGKILLKKSLQF